MQLQHAARGFSFSIKSSGVDMPFSRPRQKRNPKVYLFATSMPLQQQE